MFFLNAVQGRLKSDCTRRKTTAPHLLCNSLDFGVHHGSSHEHSNDKDETSLVSKVIVAASYKMIYSKERNEIKRNHLFSMDRAK